ncbi:MerR family transcriptional regulator [Gluconobacter japonicus]|uniref:HTH merR-type domain-containing protein n=1 Tax=Gluconobacter japonicus TaxID=376620 RepID=A0ABQ5WGB5_GLUJA|nr:MerR family transcriptional regulator [Gluconobacter japonicus]KXV25300.1 hypothetical protein AD938_11855 [Gluconobacter japonicus]MDI6652114.1 MerR family transcriptional regulator [Gluconobacter japonicus]GBR23670.1 hypothetical protein AA3271_1579 [Gluconobacter japonicus NBRC 3271]GLQ58923.1 hypothetical protein GCM10010937_07260 [Gluconobacter japonicus]
MPDKQNIIGKGVYTVSEAALLARVPAPRIRAWLFGHGADAVLSPELQPEDGHEGLTFLNLVEIRFVQELRASGVSLQAIRRMVENARRMFGTDHPFASGQFHTDGKAVFFQAAEEAPEKSLIDLTDGNGAMLDVLETSFRRSLSFSDTDGLAETWQPYAELNRIVVDAHRQFGRPIDCSGVPTQALAQALRAEKGNARKVASWWEVPEEAVTQAAEFEFKINQRLAA